MIHAAGIILKINTENAELKEIIKHLQERTVNFQQQNIEFAKDLNELKMELNEYQETIITQESHIDQLEKDVLYTDILNSKYLKRIKRLEKIIKKNRIRFIKQFFK